MSSTHTTLSVDGNTAAAHVAYAMTDMCFIYPITPSTPMGASADQWSAEGRINCFGQPNAVTEMQSEGGAAGAVHGALTGGALCTTFTASQGLLLMIPNMYKIAGELMPCVFHVAARAIAGQALSIYGEHSDIMAARSTGFSLLSSINVQEAHDFAVIAHIATLKASIPFVHFFDGFRTSHEIQKANLLKYDELKKLIPQDKVQAHRERAANPEHPHLRGTAQTPEVFFQMSEACNPYYAKVPGIVDETMESLADVLGKRYHPFEYVGPADATDLCIVMGSGCEVMVEVSQYMNATGSKTGVLKIHLYRPWSLEHFFKFIPKTVKRIVVLDRCKDAAAMGEPLFLDVCASFAVHPPFNPDTIIGGRYGLGSKDFTPGMGLSVFQNLASEKPIPRFSVGIVDDVSHMSLPVLPEPDTLPADMSQCLFWGLGSDGTVGANKDAIKIIGDHTDLTIQAYFAYDAKKSGGITQSYLRFGHTPITSPYLIKKANYIAVHKTNFVKMFDVIENIREGGTFVLNSPWDSLAELEKNLPNRLKKQIAEKNVKFYNLDATTVGVEVGLGKRINQVLQTAFFYLSGVIPFEKAKEYMKAAIKKTYGRKGDAVVQMNYLAVDKSIEHLHQIEYPASWKSCVAEDQSAQFAHMPDFVKNVMVPVSMMDGDKLPVSVFPAGGIMPPGTTQYEKRGIAIEVPEWSSDKCTQCNRCAAVCPHAAIRTFLVDDDEAKHAPANFQMLKSTVVPSMKYRVQVSPYDCTGCNLCVKACDDDALKMKELDSMIASQSENWNFAVSLPSKGDLAPRDTLRGSQFSKPLLEFSGACEGCGETPYVKMITQLFGERMIIANATGCSSIWGGTATFNPYTTNDRGQGPSWANSLFEDNAEYGMGIKIAGLSRRNRHLQLVKTVLADASVPMSPELKSLLNDWVLNFQEGPVCQRISDKLQELLPKEKANHPLLEQVYKSRDQFPKISMWIIGGDGWAYDIGYGGVDHVLASGEDVNILVLDTEMYSNTGGQCSKSTQMGAVAQFSANGKRVHKKEMAQMAMSYGHCYVASICMYSNMAQVVKAFTEAESYRGPSIIFAYSPCISMGIGRSMADSFSESQAAVDSGYWPLYRYDPRLSSQGKNPFQLDSKKLRKDLGEFLQKEVRFTSLMAKNPELAQSLQDELTAHIKSRHQQFVFKSSSAGMASSETGGVAMGSAGQLTVLYGSETGNAEGLAQMIYDSAMQRDVSVTVSALDDYDASGLPAESRLVIVCSTAGQGELPKNAKDFYSILTKLAHNSLSNVNFCVFGLGDSNYKYFNLAAKKIHDAMVAAGAKPIQSVGLGNDHDEDGFMTAFVDWEPSVWEYLKAPLPATLTAPAPKCDVTVTPGVGVPSQVRRAASSVVKLVEKKVLTPEGYDRYMMHLVFDLRDSGVRYRAGNALAIFAHNDKAEVEDVCAYLKVNPDDVVTIKPKDSRMNGVFPAVCTIRQLFTERLDLFGKPTKKFYESLSLHVKDAKEKAAILHLLSPAGKTEYSALVNESVTYVDVLKKFPSATPSLGALMDIVPQIKPRYYSIASSPNLHENELHLCIVSVDWKTPSGKQRFGLCTRYLQGLHPSASAPALIECTLKDSAMTLPEDPSVPILMAGLGTGIAPFRAFVEERAFEKRQGKKIGESAVYYGCRYEKTEYLYGEEWKSYVTEGVVQHLMPAFSRDQARKVYIQTKMDDEPEIVYDLLHKKHGNFYYCGQSGPVPGDIRKAIVNSFIKCGAMSPEAAEAAVDEMEKTGKYTVESW